MLAPNKQDLRDRAVSRQAIKTALREVENVVRKNLQERLQASLHVLGDSRWQGHHLKILLCIMYLLVLFRDLIELS